MTNPSFSSPFPSRRPSPQSPPFRLHLLHLPAAAAAAMGEGGSHPSSFFHFFDCSLTPPDRKSTRLNSSHSGESRMPSSA